MSALLKAEKLTRDFESGGFLSLGGRRRLRAVDDVSLALSAGETLGVVGESGSGKSTLARLLTALIAPSSGTLRFEGEELSASGRPAPRVRRSLQLVFQHPHAALNPRKTVEASLSGPLRALVPGSAGEHRARVERALDDVGLEPAIARRYPHELSGGQAQRVGIARALVVEPRVVVFDEAVASLDATTQSEIVELLRALQQKLGLAYVFVSHDLLLVAELSTRVLVMHRGRVVEEGDSRILVDAPTHSYTRELVASVPRFRASGRESPPPS